MRFSSGGYKTGSWCVVKWRVGDIMANNNHPRIIGTLWNYPDGKKGRQIL